VWKEGRGKREENRKKERKNGWMDGLMDGLSAGNLLYLIEVKYV
jgi:hypothetical protein